MPDVRLIDANKLLKKCIEGDGDDEFTEGYNFAVQEISAYIKLAPTVDAVPVKKDGLIFERLLVTGSQDKPYYEIEHIENGKHYIGYSSYNIDVISQYLKDYFGINAVPVKRGKWEHGRCKECGKSLEDLFSGEFYYDEEEVKFCPHCGAKME